MSKILSSADFFKSQNVPLSKRQSGGAMDKRQAASVDLAARRLLHKPFKLGGIVGASARRGYENVFDVIVSRNALYCLVCGTSNENDCKECKLCFHTQFTSEKFGTDSNGKLLLTCLTCDKPFYTKECRPLPPTESKAIFPIAKKSKKLIGKDASGKFQFSVQTDSDVAAARYNAKLEAFENLTCKCFAERKKQRRFELSQKATVKRIETKTEVERAASIKKATARLSELEAMNFKSFDRKKRDNLFAERAALLKVLSLSV